MVFANPAAKCPLAFIKDPPSEDRIGYVLESPGGTFPALAVNGPVSDEELHKLVDSLMPAKDYLKSQLAAGPGEVVMRNRRNHARTIRSLRSDMAVPMPTGSIAAILRRTPIDGCGAMAVAGNGRLPAARRLPREIGRCAAASSAWLSLAKFETYVFSSQPAWTGPVEIRDCIDLGSLGKRMFMMTARAPDGRHLVLVQSATYNRMLPKKIKDGTVVYTAPNGFKVWGGGPQKWYSKILLQSAHYDAQGPACQGPHRLRPGVACRDIPGSGGQWSHQRRRVARPGGQPHSRPSMLERPGG